MFQLIKRFDVVLANNQADFGDNDEVAILEKRLAERKVLLGKKRNTVEYYTATVKSEYGYLLDALAETNKYIQNLVEEFNTLYSFYNPSNHTEQHSEEEYTEWREAYDEVFRFQESEARSEKSEIVKKLFRFIAAKTHPDKIVDKELNELFIEAYEAYKAGDEQTLQEISDYLKTGNRLLRKLMARISELKAEIQEVEKEISDVVNGSQYQIALELRKNRSYGLSIIHRQLTEQINKKNEVIQELKAKIVFLREMSSKL